MIIIRNKHNISEDTLARVNAALAQSWFSEIYGKHSVFLKDGLALSCIQADYQQTADFMDDLVRAMKRYTEGKDFYNSVFELTFITENLNYSGVKAGAAKFVLKDGVLLKLFGNIEEIPFKMAE